MFLFIIGSKHFSGGGVVALQHLHSLIHFLNKMSDYSFMSSLTMVLLLSYFSYVIFSCSKYSFSC